MQPRVPPFSLNVAATVAEAVEAMEVVVAVVVEDAVDTVDTVDRVELETDMKVNVLHACYTAIACSCRGCKQGSDLP